MKINLVSFLIVITLSHTLLAEDTLNSKAKSLAQFTRQYYLALIQEGFSKDEALTIVAQYQDKQTTQQVPSITKTPTPKKKTQDTKKTTAISPNKTVLKFHDNGSMTLNQQPIVIDKLIERLKKKNITPDQWIVVDAGEKVKFNDIEKVVNLLTSQNFTKVTFDYRGTE